MDGSALVAVVDDALPRFEELIEQAKARPWMRSYLISTHVQSQLVPASRLVQKPFDAAWFACALRFEYQLADLDRQRHTETQRLESELQHSQRLAHLGQIAATMSHEINNPLAVIRSCAAWIAEYAAQNPEPDLVEVAADLELASERIGGFVEQMSGFSRKGPPSLRDVPIARAVEVALRLVRPRAAEKGVQLELVDPNAMLHRAMHDSGRISQAILNLLANAVDAAALGGRQVWIDVERSAAHLHVRVADNGPGVPDEIGSRAFEPFATTKPPGQGTGLGLPLCRAILLEHAGNVTLSARPGGGTVAELVWPVGGPLRGEVH